MTNINLLIVDDKPENIIALEALLDRTDINLISTTSPNEALKICWDQDIAIALIDVQMPEMNGFELTQILKSNAKTKDILIIFVTAISKENRYAVQGLNTGAVDYLFKPLDPEITLAKVDSFIQLVKIQREIRLKNQQLEAYQKELIKAKELAEQARKSKESFLANMSHEIRTPINGIIGITNLLQQTPLDDNQSQMLGMLQSSSNSLLGIINDILDLSKIEAGKFSITPTETNIKLFCRQVYDLLNVKAKEKGISFVLDLDPSLPECIMADSLRLNQIFLNLLSNAIKFTDYGSVHFAVQVINQKTEIVELQFSVKDSGIGISKEDLPKIFDSFEQVGNNDAKVYGGTGLGLSIVKRLADLKGAKLEVASEVNVGSTFTLTKWYPVVDARKEAKAHQDEKKSLEGLKILLAEDSPINKFLVLKILKDWQVETTVVENGQEALDQLSSSAIDLILMDTYMPVMNGLEAIKVIRQDFPSDKKDIPIISFSAGVMDSDRETAMAAGADDIIGKPFKVDELYEKIKKLTKEKLQSSST